MSSDQTFPPQRHVAEHLRRLLAELERWEPAQWEAIRALVGNRKARIVLDEEAALVHFVAGRLQARTVPLPKSRPIPQPYGRTDRQSTVAMLTGHLEVGEAIMDGRLELHGSTDDVIDICSVIEMLVDSSTRVPELQHLARDFLGEARADLVAERRHRAEKCGHLQEIAEAEKAMLRRYGLTNPPSAL
jgi:hypothetical protein